MRQKNNLILFMMVVSILSVQTIFARISGWTSSGDGPTSTTSSSSSTVSDVSFSDDETKSCDLTSAGNYLSQEFLRTIVDSNERPNVIKVDYKKNGDVGISIPKYLAACTDLKIRYAKSGNDHFIRVQNGFDFNVGNVGLSDSPEDKIRLDNMAHTEKYERCLKKKLLLSEDNQIIEENITSSVTSFGTVERIVKPKGTNAKESVNLYYISPKATEYGTAFPATTVKSKLRTPCVAYENINENKVMRLRTSKKDLRIQHVMKVCQNRNPEELSEEIAKLLKNGDEDNFSDIFRRVLDDVNAERSVEVYARMSEIELELRNDEDGEGPTRDEAIELVGEYAKLSEEFQKTIISPKVSKIRELLANRNPDNIKATDRKIAELQESLKEFAAKDPLTSNLKFVYDAAKRHGLTKTIRKIEDLRVSSQVYAKVGKGKGSIKFSKANSIIEEKLDAFDASRLDKWDDHYSLRSGNDTIIDRLETRIRSAMSGLDRDLNGLERQNQSCNSIPVSNPGDCQNWQEDYPREKAFLIKQRDKKLAYVKRLSEKHQCYVEIYEQGQATCEDDDEEDTHKDKDGKFVYFGKGKDSSGDTRVRRRRNTFKLSSSDDMSRARKRDISSYQNRSPSPIAQQFQRFQQQWAPQNMNQNYPQQNGQTIFGPRSANGQQNNQFQPFNLNNRAPAVQQPNYAPSYTSYLRPNVAMQMNNNSFMNQNQFQMGMTNRLPFYGYPQLAGQSSSYYNGQTNTGNMNRIMGPGLMNTQQQSQYHGFPQQMGLPPMAPAYNFSR